MKKIVAVFDGNHFSNGVVNFVKGLNIAEPVLLTGLFVPSVDYSEIMYYYLGMNAPVFIPDFQSDYDILDATIEKFEAFCKSNQIEYRIHKITDIDSIEAIRKETRYADIMLLGNELFFENLGADTQEKYLRETLHKAECPVIIVPEHYDLPQSVIIAFDGSASSAFALKQFAYLFPQLSELSTLIVYTSTEENVFPDLSYVKELGARHYKDLTLLKLDADPQKYFNTWLMNKGQAILVSGSYGRSALSGLLKHSFVQDVLQDHKLPVFIAHL